MSPTQGRSGTLGIGSTAPAPPREERMETRYYEPMVDLQQDLSLNTWASLCHTASRDAGWWTDLATGKPKDRNKGEMFMLMVSELAEGFEGERKSQMDDHLPTRRSVEVEMADLLIRVFDYAGAHNLDLDGAVRAKMDFNRKRDDHKPENRMKADGKKF